MAVDFYLISSARRLQRLKSERAYIFGRDEKADIQVLDQLISRKHAELRWRGEDVWMLKDLGSRNGVLLNGRKLAAATVVKDGAIIQVGGQRYRVCFVPPGADPNGLLDRAPKISDDETMGPDFSVEDIVQKGASFTGAVDAGGLLDLLQFFQVTSKTGRLDLTGGTSLGAMWFQGGMPLHAIPRHSILGTEAVISLGRNPPSRFAFHPGAPPPDQRTISGSLAGLLIEVARVLDEDQPTR